MKRFIPIKYYISIVKDKLKEELKCYSTRPHLGAIYFGDNPASDSYIKGIKKDCDELGYEFTAIKVESSLANSYVVRTYVDSFTKTPSVHGIIIQKPLPDSVDLSIFDSINPGKDVDGSGKDSIFYPCTPLGVINYLKFNGYRFEGKNACVIGRSDTVGKPLAKMLLDLNCTVTICHSKSDLRRTLTSPLMSSFSCQDIIFTCIDKIEFFDESYFAPTQDVIDIGLGIGKDGKLHGNLTEEAYIHQKEYTGLHNSVVISGVGGTGLLTRLELLKNTFKAFKLDQWS